MFPPYQQVNKLLIQSLNMEESKEYILTVSLSSSDLVMMMAKRLELPVYLKCFLFSLCPF